MPATQSGNGAVRGPGGFGKRREPASVTIERNGVTRRFHISPLLFSACISLFAMFMVGYLGATAYLVLRDDLIGMTHARNARLMHEYEDRIASLRANLDRVTSRQLLDQQAIESRVAELMRRQEMLGGRDSRIGQLLDAAAKRGLEPAPAAKAEPPAAPLTTGSLKPQAAPLLADLGSISLRGSTDATSLPGAPGTGPQALEASPLQLASRQPATDLSNIHETASMFESVSRKMATVDTSQRQLLDGLRQSASDRARKLAGVIGKLGVALPEQSGIGGPYIPLAREAEFDEHVEALAGSLEALDALTGKIRSLPVATPARGHQVSSAFGRRVDPFLGTTAMHSGIDFRAPTGAPVKATADGTVIAAGRNGGYGNMVEIRHASGLTTRYAHLSKITVKEGQAVRRGKVIGAVGSTGRSTGPHLHYEVRRNGDAVNPATYLKAGREIAAALK